MARWLLVFFSLTTSFVCGAQLKWQNVDSVFQPLPASVHVYFTESPLDSAPFKAFYVIADLKDKNLRFTTDTTSERRITPSQFYNKNNQPLVVVNGTFFSFETNRNLNTVIKDGKTVVFDNHIRPLRGKDTLLYAKFLPSAIGISKKREADVAWLYNEAGQKKPLAFEQNPKLIRDSVNHVSIYDFVPQLHHPPKTEKRYGIKKWKMQTAIGGGPVLLHNSAIRIANNEEMKFSGKGIRDKHPRTAMGYTQDNKLVILVVEGRNENAGGATLVQEAQILKDLGCIEALNLDGGGSSCLLINGKETIRPSDKGNQRAVPAVFIIKRK